MLRFSHPLAWWALTALAVPLILHLWRPPARTVRLGSIRFLRGAPRRNLRNLRWREPLLLLTRLLLLALLVLVLVGPAWVRPAPRVPQRWVLVSAGATMEGTVLDRLCALQSTGYQMRRFTSGFPATDVQAIAPDQEANPDGLLDAWSLLREADSILPQHSKVVVFTPGRVTDLCGTRPTLQHCEVEWVQTPSHHQEDQPWIDSLQQTGSGNASRLTAYVGTGNTKLTRYLTQQLPSYFGRTPLAGVAGKWEAEVSGGAGAPFSARLANDGRPIGGQVVAQQVSPLRVSILHDPDRAEDARYVEAAIRAVARGEGREAMVSSDQHDLSPTEIDVGHRWVFWLSVRRVPDAVTRVIEAGASLITDTPVVDPPRGETWLVAPVGVKAPYLPPGKIAWRRKTDLPETANAVCTDGFGEPALAWSRSGQGAHWQLASRFQPSWNDLPSSGVLPTMLRSLFRGPLSDQGARSLRDQRIAGVDQGTPKTLDSKVEPRAFLLSDEPVRWSGLLWATALFCFCLERWLSSFPVVRSASTLPVNSSRASAMETIHT